MLSELISTTVSPLALLLSELQENIETWSEFEKNKPQPLLAISTPYTGPSAVFLFNDGLLNSDYVQSVNLSLFSTAMVCARSFNTS